MVTVYHQQSRLAVPTRVILETTSLRYLKTKLPDIEREFDCGHFSFSVIENANQIVIQHGFEDIRSGRSAAVIPNEKRQPSALFFDMDATVITEESLVEIAKCVGKAKEIEQLTTRAMAGGMDFKDSLRLRLSILKGITREQILAITPTLSQGMTQLAEWCHHYSIPMFLVSGGFVDLAGPVAQGLGFKDYKANRFSWDGDIMDGRVDGEIIDGEGKRNAVREWCRVYNLTASNCVTVGDGANDQYMMEISGLAVGFKPKQALWPVLHVANHTGDHKFLIHALTPAKEEPI